VPGPVFLLGKQDVGLVGRLVVEAERDNARTGEHLAVVFKGKAGHWQKTQSWRKHRRWRCRRSRPSLVTRILVPHILNLSFLDLFNRVLLHPSPIQSSGRWKEFNRVSLATGLFSVIVHNEPVYHFTCQVGVKPETPQQKLVVL
jgi:hypothetical protein